MASPAFLSPETSIAADDFAVDDPDADVFATVRATDKGVNFCSLWAIRRASVSEMHVSAYRIKNGKSIQTADGVRWSVPAGTTPREFAERFVNGSLSTKAKAARDAHDAAERGIPVSVSDQQATHRPRLRAVVKRYFVRACLGALDRLDGSAR